MSSKGVKLEGASKAVATNGTQTEQPKLYERSFWYLQFYNQDADGDTQLHVLMAHLPTYTDCAQRLIDETWPVSLLNIGNNDGMTALHLAVINNQPDMVRYLLINGANPMSKDNWGRTPLHCACKKNNIDMINALTNDFKPLEITKMNCKKLIIPDLSKSIHERNHNGETPLFVATENGLLNIVKQLVNLGAKINTINYRDGHRPLYVAIRRGYKDITKFILNYYQANPDGNTRFEYCYPELMKPLEQMELDKAFITILKLPIDRMYPQSSSDKPFNTMLDHGSTYMLTWYHYLRFPWSLVSFNYHINPDTSLEPFICITIDSSET